MSDFGSPLRPKKVKEVKEEKIVPEKKVLSAATCKALLDYKGDIGDGIIRWTERWLVQLVRERSYPPQIAGSDALGALTQYLTPSDALNVLETIRRDFRREHQALCPKEDFSDLVKALTTEGIPLSSPIRYSLLDERCRHILGL